jgi:hypothetical protein
MGGHARHRVEVAVSLRYARDRMAALCETGNRGVE